MEEELKKKQAELEAKAKELEAKAAALEEANRKFVEKMQSTFIQTSSSNSSEALLMRKLGCKSVQDLLKVNTGVARITKDEAQLIKQLKLDVQANRIICQVFKGAPEDRSTKDEFIPARIKGILDTDFAKQHDIDARLKAFGSTVVGGGAEYVPTLIASDYIQEYNVISNIAQIFSDIPMPSATFQLPIKKNGTKARVATEGATVTPSNFTSDKLELASKKLFEYYEMPEELTEDSVVDFLQLGKEEVINAHVKGIESAAINGDTSLVHMDSDIAALGADVSEKHYKGLRKRALDNAANNVCIDFAGGVSNTKIKAMLSAMGKFMNPSECAWLFGCKTYIQATTLDELLTIEKFGAYATIVKGSLANLYGIPVFTSEFLSDRLNAAGVYDGVTTDNGAAILVNKTRFKTGLRRPLQMAVIKNPNIATDNWLLAGYQRKAFNGFDQDATETSVIYGYNITV